MRMLPAFLLAASAAIILLLGLAHLLFTFYGPKLVPRDPELQARMREVSPVISRETSMWRAWVGFNASHSLGAILFGAIYGYLSLIHSAFLFQSTFLLSLGLLLLIGYVGTYRAVYTVKFAEAVFVLHCFQKKSKRGIATPKEDMDIIHARLKIAEAFAKELRK
jgi:hypothetical protein